MTGGVFPTSADGGGARARATTLAPLRLAAHSLVPISAQPVEKVGSAVNSAAVPVCVPIRPSRRRTSATAIPEGVVTTSVATIEVLSVSTLNVPEAHPVRTAARLTVPSRAKWQTIMAGDSLTLALETGGLRVDLRDGRARIARATDSILGIRTLDDIAPGQEAIMWAGDRLVIHGNGSLLLHGVGEMTAIATIVRITTPR